MLEFTIAPSSLFGQSLLFFILVQCSKSTAFAPKCKHFQSYLNMLKHGKVSKLCLGFSEDKVRGFLPSK